ncbi:cytochrome c [Aureimonas sp. AU22]|jgi:cytochrome c556|uniref:c-type cytochrome n=1 Tax=Aureimonas sp. AU22 TaxID=1638162 RepID=UPI0009EC4571|nr:cytochrome c [Aureimonas sp. AU22]
MPTWKMGFAGLVISAALMAPLVPAVAQNTDVIAERQQLMKNNAKAARAASALIKGEEPYEASKATDILQTLNTDAKKFGTLFPEDSKTGGKTEASPAIWEKPDEFQAANAKFVADTQAALDAKPADVDAFKTAFAGVAANCQSCHQQFRAK